jgi:hypothetical protein
LRTLLDSNEIADPKARGFHFERVVMDVGVEFLENGRGDVAFFFSALNNSVDWRGWIFEVRIFPSDAKRIPFTGTSKCLFSGFEEGLAWDLGSHRSIRKYFCASAAATPEEDRVLDFHLLYKVRFDDLMEQALRIRRSGDLRLTNWDSINSKGPTDSLKDVNEEFLVNIDGRLVQPDFESP